MGTAILDLDDFHEDDNQLDKLYKLRCRLPTFKVNLFTIPGRCSRCFIEEVRKIEWVNMVPHGFVHDTPRECEKWEYEESLSYLRGLEETGWERGFKAPGWNISDGMYQALQERGWWVADHPKNALRRPRGLRYYDWTLNKNALHGHIGHLAPIDNEIEQLWPQIMNLEGNVFQFIKDLL